MNSYAASKHAVEGLTKAAALEAAAFGVRHGADHRCKRGNYRIMKTAKIPNAEHPILISPNRARVRVTVGGRVVADTTRALTLRESDYPPVQYVPRDDVDMSVLERSKHQSYCSYKGDAAYYSVTIDGRGRNAVWTYEAPYQAVAEIKDHLAFYPDRVDSIEETPIP